MFNSLLKFFRIQKNCIILNKVRVVKVVNFFSFQLIINLFLRQSVYNNFNSLPKICKHSMIILLKIHILY